MSFTSKNNLFSSSCLEAVKAFDAAELNTKQDCFNNRAAILHFSLAGDFPLAFEVLREESRIYDLCREKERELCRGNFNPLKVRRALHTFRKNLWIAAGYDTAGREYIHVCSLDQA